MKKATVIVLLALLSLGLIISWTFFLAQKNEASKLELIDTKEKAQTVGIAYIEIAYPELNINNGSYSFLVLHFSDDSGPSYWGVLSSNREQKSSKDAPAVFFRENGEIINIGLQADGLKG